MEIEEIALIQSVREGLSGFNINLIYVCEEGTGTGGLYVLCVPCIPMGIAPYNRLHTYFIPIVNFSPLVKVE